MNEYSEAQMEQMRKSSHPAIGTGVASLRSSSAMLGGSKVDRLRAQLRTVTAERDAAIAERDSLRELIGGL